METWNRQPGVPPRPPGAWQGWGSGQQAVRRAGSRVPLALALCVAAAGALLAVTSVLVTAFAADGGRTMRVRSDSMAPTYQPGSIVTVHDTGGSPVRRGQVVVFSARDWGTDQVFMQRVVGVGGDRVAIDPAGVVSVNGTALGEPYLAPGPTPGMPVDVTVPAGRLFLLGDHRNDAVDSRSHQSEQEGTIAQAAVVGTVSPGTSAPSPDRLWTWAGTAVALAGLGAAGVAAAVRRRGTAAPAWPPAAP
ncbi:signal peptidase I [Actinacidiphila rubida]|uniref:Signal peptidase I n=1 Tax=Actinacidiphila rubida TaxID=310780 RepID=A0A1H8PFU3_9ACTN|nr:signal peptidase I [Actinacidiphila rubida]SEO40423.1 signal peptidase I [Actinacidiphila rubida]